MLDKNQMREIMNLVEVTIEKVIDNKFESILKESIGKKLNIMIHKRVKKVLKEMNTTGDLATTMVPKGKGFKFSLEDVEAVKKASKSPEEAKKMLLDIKNKKKRLTENTKQVFNENDIKSLKDRLKNNGGIEDNDPELAEYLKEIGKQKIKKNEAEYARLLED